MDKETVGSIHWHDGHLDQINFTVEKSKSNIQMKLRLYKDQDAPNRRKVILKFIDVVSWQTSIDVMALFNNRFAGEIGDAWLAKCSQERKKGILTFRMYFTDGFLEINSKEMGIF